MCQQFFHVHELYLNQNFASSASAQISSHEKKIYGSWRKVKIKEALHQCLNKRIDSAEASSEEGAGDGEHMTSPPKFTSNKLDLRS